MDCIFCKIINGEIPAKTLYENEYVKVFMDINPSTNGHMLIVPKKHFTDFTELTDEYLLEINKVTKKMSELILNKLSIKGLSLAVNYGDRQDVKHYHMHIIPNDNTKIKSVEEMFDLLK